MRTCIIAEKPSVARDIARVVGANTAAEGYLHGNGFAVTWALGHLVQLAMPTDYGYTAYLASDLPIIPKPPRLIVRTIRKGSEIVTDPGAMRQIKIIEQRFNDAEAIVVATDAGREGELIFRFIYEYLECKKPFQRLWISSLTDKAIRDGMAHLREGHEYDALARAARARAEADWIVGINASRALSIAAGTGSYSLGRVQTPTLALVVRRFLEHRHFEPRQYYRIAACIECDGQAVTIKSEETFAHRDDAQKAWQRLQANTTLSVEQVDRGERVEQPPRLHDLTSLQREANRAHGLSAEQTLKVAQRLYEKKLITYPRTGSQHITEDIMETIPGLIASLEQHPLRGEAARAMRGVTLNRQPVDAAQVTDPHALLITGATPGELDDHERTILEMIATRMLEAFSAPAVYQAVSATMTAGGITFKCGVSVPRELGWKAIARAQAQQTDEEEPERGEIPLRALPAWERGQAIPMIQSGVHTASTKPKPLFTDATLLAAMEHAGRELETSEQKDAIRDTGLGTPATRAAIIETMIGRGYVERQKRCLVPTPKGLAVYDIVKAMRIANPELTATWEIALAAIEEGRGIADEFNQRIGEYAAMICQELLACRIQQTDHGLETCPRCGKKTLVYRPKLARCTDEQCGLKVWRTHCAKELTQAQLRALVQKGKTPLIQGLVSKAGSTFAAHILLDPSTGRTSLQFPEKSTRNNSNR